MRESHLRSQLTAHGERIGGKDEQGGGAGLIHHAREAGGLEAAIGVDAADHRQPIADLVDRRFKQCPLLVEGTAADLGRMAIDGHSGKPMDCRDVPQVLAGVPAQSIE